MTHKKHLFFSGLIFLILYFFLELSSYAVLTWLDQVKGIRYESYTFSNLSEKHRVLIQKLINRKTKYLGFDPDLGWAPKKNGRNDLYIANASGFRANREYQDFPPEGKLRIAAFGDSFTQDYDVSNEKMWTAQLEERDERLEVLNFGVGGYGLDQSYLRYQKEWKNFYPEVVLIGFGDENIRRVVNTYRPFLYPQTGIPLSKPRFHAAEGELLLIKNPMQKIEDYGRLLRETEKTIKYFSKNDYYAQNLLNSSSWDILPTVRLVKLWYARSQKIFPEKIEHRGKYNSQFEGYQIVTTIFDHFYASVQRNAAEPVIVLFATKGTLRKYLKNKIKVYQPLIDDFEKKGYRYVDSLDVFFKVRKEYSVEELFSKARYPHYSEIGSKVISEALYRYLEKEKLFEEASPL